MCSINSTALSWVSSILLLTSSLAAYSQDKLPILHTNSEALSIRDGDNFRSNYWNIDASIEIDTYTADKFNGSKSVTFISDIDSIIFSIDRGSVFDFLIVLNSKDTCLTRIESGIKKVDFEDGNETIPFTITASNNIAIEAVLDKRDTLTMMFHSDARSVGITYETLERLIDIKVDGSVSAESWGGQNEAGYSKNHELEVGNLNWQNLIIWTDRHSGKGTDGKFGPHLFENKILEINYDEKFLRIHNTLMTIPKDYNRYPLIFNQESMFVEIEMEIDNELYSNHFLIHTGYSGGLLLNDKFSNEHRLGDKLEIIKESELRDSYDNVLKKKDAILPRIKIGDFELSDVPAGFFEGKVGNQHLSVVGCEVLQKFNIIFDLQNAFIYLKPNACFEIPFKS